MATTKKKTTKKKTTTAKKADSSEAQGAQATESEEGGESEASSDEGQAGQVQGEAQAGAGKSAEAEPRQSEGSLFQKPQPSGGGKLAKIEPSPEIVERVTELVESLETFQEDEFRLPLIRFKEDFELSEGGEHVETFEGVIVYTKASNVYYAGSYKPGQTQPPDCFSPDGVKPNVPEPMHPTCKGCPKNQFGSGTSGEGKACKNTRPVFILVKNPEAEEGEFPYSALPKVLRVPPTSLNLIRSYITSLAADYGAYYNVETKFTVFKKSDDQSHFNIKFLRGSRLRSEHKQDVRFIREQLMPTMREGHFGLDEEQAGETPAAGSAGGPQPDQGSYDESAF